MKESIWEVTTKRSLRNGGKPIKIQSGFIETTFRCGNVRLFIIQNNTDDELI